MPNDAAIRRVAVFGGTGFLGREIVTSLADAGFAVRVAVRNPDKVDGVSGVEPVYADVRDETSVGLALEWCDAAVNAVGLYMEKGPATFEAVHEHGAMNLARQCAALGVRRLVHVSGIGADPDSPSAYVRSRGKGEAMVRDAYPSATVFRPSVMFAPGDKFINALAGIARMTPVIPLFGRGETRLQPVYAGDVAKAVVSALQDPGSSGKTYELGGPRTYTYRALLELILERTGRRRLLLPVPFAAWDALAACASVLPNPPLARGQVALMKKDNVAAKEAPGLAGLGVEPTLLEDVLPRYAL